MNLAGSINQLTYIATHERLQDQIDCMFLILITLILSPYNISLSHYQLYHDICGKKSEL